MAVLMIIALLFEAAVGSPGACTAREGCVGRQRASLMQRDTKLHQSGRSVSDGTGTLGAAKLFESVLQFKTSSSQKAGEELVHNLAAMLSSSGTPEVAAAATKILALLGEQRAAIEAAHKTVQEELNFFEEFWKRLSEKFELHLDLASAAEKSMIDNETAHTHCRGTESKFQKAVDDAHAKLEDAKQREKEISAQEMEAWDELAALRRGRVKNRALRERANKLSDQLWEAEDARMDREREYKAAVEMHSEKQKICNDAQFEFERSVCQLALDWDKACWGYSDEYERAVTDYNLIFETVHSAEADRVEEWTVIEKVSCAVQKLSETSGGADGDVQNAGADFEICFSKEVDADSLRLKYPTIPDKKQCPVVEKRPCSGEFVQKSYDSMPQNAPATKCRFCCLDPDF